MTADRVVKHELCDVWREKKQWENGGQRRRDLRHKKVLSSSAVENVLVDGRSWIARRKVFGMSNIPVYRNNVIPYCIVCR